MKKQPAELGYKVREREKEEKREEKEEKGRRKGRRSQGVYSSTTDV